MEDKYFWTHESGVKIEDFLKKTRPSIITSDMTPWIWVRGTTSIKEDPERSADHSGALAKAHKIMDRLATRMKEVDEDDSIPVRKKKGGKSKKDAKEEAHEVAAEELKELSIESKWTVGKWLFFPRQSEVDGIWSVLAQSVADGPLKGAGVDLAKVAPSPQTVQEGQNVTHVICLYMDDVYNKKLVEKVLLVLLKEHGLEPSACKSDLYTLAGIDSSHPTKLRSSIWRPVELIEGGGAVIKEMKDEHRANRAKRSSGGEKTGPKINGEGLIESDSEDERVVQAAKRKCVSPVKDVMETPAAKNEVKRKTAPPPAKKARTAAMKYADEDVFAGADGDDSD